MKINRDQLKMLVKECLIEILQDGVGEQLTERRKPAPRVAKRSHDPVLDAPAKVSMTQSLVEAVKEQAAGNRVMEQIFADTAVTTLPKMLNERAAPSGNSKEDLIVAQHDPEELFGTDAASKWEQLAFMQVKPGQK